MFSRIRASWQHLWCYLLYYSYLLYLFIDLSPWHCACNCVLQNQLVFLSMYLERDRFFGLLLSILSWIISLSWTSFPHRMMWPKYFNKVLFMVSSSPWCWALLGLMHSCAFPSMILSILCQQNILKASMHCLSIVLMIQLPEAYVIMGKPEIE